MNPEHKSFVVLMTLCGGLAAAVLSVAGEWPAAAVVAGGSAGMIGWAMWDGRVRR
jgi:hypothetical protein